MNSAIRSSSVRFRLVDLRWYALAALSVAIALGIALVLQHFQFRDAAIPLLAFACAITSWYGGARPALLAVVLSSMWFAYFFAEPIYSFRVRASDFPYFIVFVSFASLVSWFATIRRRAEEKARDSEKELRDLIAEMPAMAFSVRPDGSNEFASRRWQEYTGSSDDERTGRGWEATVHPDDFDLHLSKWRASLESGEPFENEVRHRAVTGEYRWFLARAVPLRDEHGDILKWYGTLTDIEDRKRAEEALRRTATELRDLIETMPSLAFSTWPDGSGEFTTGRWREYSGLSTEETFRERGASTIHPNDRGQHLSKWRASLASGEPFENEARHRSAKDEYRWFLVRAVPLRDEQGNILKWYGILTDIEDRKRAEEALRRSESYLAEAQKLARTGSWAWGRTTGETLYWSDEMFRMFALDPEQGLPSTETFWQRVHPQDRDCMFELMRNAVRKEISYEHDHRIVLPDGTVKQIHAIGHPVRDQAGNVVEYVGTSMDVTERKRAEDTIRRSEAYLAEAQRMTRTGSWAYSNAIGKAIYWSEETFRIFGLDPRGGPPDYGEIVRLTHPEDCARFRENTATVFREKCDFEQDYRLVLPDGTVKHIHEIGHPVREETGEVTVFVGTAMDVTEQVQNREALEKAFEEIKTLKDQLYKENLALRDEVVRTSMFEEIVGASSALQAVLARVARVGPTDSTVLITGETGTGKELIARAIHKRSRRSGRAFVSVNCAALAPSLISSELFGHEKGAFTGATQRRMGRFELADGGTIFLDEVGELPPETQVALLRVLQEREFERVGGTQPVQVDVRVIAATNRDLKAAIANGTVRQDLYYRLNVFPIGMPALRERKDDILVLVEYFVQRYARTAGKQIRSIDKETVELFRSYEWPGNIRELQNVVERSVILTSGDVLRVDESWLPTESPQRYAQVQAPVPSDDKDSGERQIIEAALAESRGRIAGPKGAAAKLGIPPSTLEYKIKALKIRKSPFKFG